MNTATLPIPLPELWAAMLATYGHRWASAYGQNPDGVAAATWATALSGLSRAQIAAGMRACLTFGDGWPPTLPEFRGLCLGIPALSTVRGELTRADAERSPFTRFTWGLIDSHRYRQASADQADRMLRDAYELAREERMRGAPLPAAPAGAITDDTRRAPTPASPERAQAAIDECLGMLASASPRVEPLSDEAQELQQRLEGGQL